MQVCVLFTARTLDILGEVKRKFDQIRREKKKRGNKHMSKSNKSEVRKCLFQWLTPAGNFSSKFFPFMKECWSVDGLFFGLKTCWLFRGYGYLYFEFKIYVLLFIGIMAARRIWLSVIVFFKQKTATKLWGNKSNKIQINRTHILFISSVLYIHAWEALRGNLMWVNYSLITAVGSWIHFSK